MSAPDPREEMEAAVKRVRTVHLQRLQDFGVSIQTIADFAEKFGIGVVEAEPGPNGTYTPGSGPLHLVLPVVEGGAVLDGGGVVDLVAFRPLTPDSWRLRCGNGWALGADCLSPERRWDLNARIELHDTPLNWLRSGGRGICIVDWESPEVRMLADLERVEVANAALGKVLLETLSRPIRLPVIEHRRALHVA